MIKKQSYVSPESELVVFLETTVLCESTQLNPITDNPDTIEWLSPII